MSIFKLFGWGDRSTPSGEGAETETVRKITEALDRMDPDEARYLAAFAYILGRVASADSQVAPEETRAMERLVMEHGQLLQEQALIVVQIAKTQNLLFGGTENYLVTREFARLATRDQKLALLHCLFAVSSSEGSIATVEDNEIRRIAQECGLDHNDFIDVRLQYRRHLSVLQRPEDEPAG